MLADLFNLFIDKLDFLGDQFFLILELFDSAQIENLKLKDCVPTYVSFVAQQIIIIDLFVLQFDCPFGFAEFISLFAIALLTKLFLGALPKKPYFGCPVFA